jgi:hypothetical protein
MILVTSNRLCLRTECHREEGCYQWWGGQRRGKLQIIREHGWIQGLKDQWKLGDFFENKRSQFGTFGFIYMCLLVPSLPAKNLLI